MSDFTVKVRKTLSSHARAAMRALRSLRWRLAPLPATRPVFIVGCSRSGTTLVYKTFSESREIGSLQRETHEFWSLLHPPEKRGWDSHGIPPDRASAADREMVSRYFYVATGHSRFVDKDNQNGLSLPYLHALFPDACFVYVKRSPGDNIASLIEGWRRPDEFGTWSADLPEDVLIDDGRYRRWCFFIAGGWRDYCRASIEEVCAFQYRAMNEAILAARAGIPAAQWLEIAYEQLLDDPVGGFRRLFEGCGLRFTPELQQHCATVLQRPYNAFSAIGREKWRDSPDRERIARVLPSVADVAARMGYPPVD